MIVLLGKQIAVTEKGDSITMVETRFEWVVSDVIKHLNDAQKIEMLTSPRLELCQFHNGLGRRIRNRYGLWRDKSLAEIGKEHPNDTSGVIIEKVWDKLRETEAAGFGFVERPCVDCGESVLVSPKEAKEVDTGWCYDCAKYDQAYEPWMTGGE